MTQSIKKKALAFVVSACLVLAVPGTALGASPSPETAPSDAVVTFSAQDSGSLSTLAVASKRVSGRGANSSKTVALTKGVWAVSYQYTRNYASYGSGGTYFSAYLDSNKLSYRKSLTDNRSAVTGKGRHNILITDAGRYWVDVSSASARANWVVVFTKVGLTTAKKFSGVGEADTKRFKLQAGKTYRFTVKYSGNRDTFGASNFIVWLTGSSSSSYGKLLVNDIRVGRTVTKLIKITKTDYYWLNIDSALPKAKWTAAFR
ncbi:MAG: hypothetical protein LBL86_10965 [Coriobacteriales bacterium]|nr:hypothetical protein [Coriobacteriales bacterium]